MPNAKTGEPAGWVRCDFIVPVEKVRCNVIGTDFHFSFDAKEGQTVVMLLSAEAADDLMWELIRRRAEQRDSAAMAIMEAVAAPIPA